MTMEGLLERGKTRISTVCTDLGLCDNVTKLATSLWEALSVNVEQNLMEDLDQWLICIVYIASVDSRYPYGLTDPQAGQLSHPQVSVTQLLQHFKTNVLDFFKKMRVVKDVCPLSEAAHNHLLAVEKKFCITSAIYHKFTRIFEESIEKDYHVNDRGQGEESLSLKKKICWTLFVLAKSQLLGNNEELVTAFHLLLCCVDHVLATVSSSLHTAFGISRSNEENELADSLRDISHRFVADYEEVKSMHTLYFAPFLQRLSENKSDLELDELLGSYKVHYKQDGDIDETLFLSDDPHLLVQVPHKNSTQVEVKYTKEHPPVTPVRSALNTVQQLRTLLTHSNDSPSAKLLQYYKNCTKDPTQAIEKLHKELRLSFVTSFVKDCGDHQESLAQQRFTSAVSLYYRVLENMLIQEEERLSKMNFSDLLNNSVFHKCLMACAVEIVILTYSHSWSTPLYSESSNDSRLMFPWILRVFHIHGYDFHKVLESFIKAEPKLTRDTIKHLHWIENKILESIAWESDSPLYDALAKYELIQPSVPATSNSTATAADLYLSPIRPSQSIVSPNVMLTPTSNKMEPPKSPRTPEHSMEAKPQAPPRRSQSLNLFFSKVCKLGFYRMQSLCNLLSVSKDLQQKIWTCFDYCMTQRFDLLKDRHLDQIMMCSVYSICKVVEQEIKFKVIVNMYKDLPHTSEEVYKRVRIEAGVTDSIIGFYNSVFTHRMKTYILQFSLNKQMMPSLSPLPKSVVSPLKASPVYSLPGKRNFYVSPMKESPFKMPPSPSQLTPRSRQLYSFGEGFGSSEKLKNINEALRMMRKAPASSPGPCRGQKCLKFDESVISESASNADLIVNKGKPSPHMRKCLAFSDPDKEDKQAKE